MTVRLLHQICAALACTCCSHRVLRQKSLQTRELVQSPSGTSFGFPTVAKSLAMRLLALKSRSGWQSLRTGRHSREHQLSQRQIATRLPRRAEPVLAESEEGDWRDFRARLVAQEQGDSEGSADKDGFAFECPLIEQGSVIMGGTKMSYGFALRQQYFHKTVILLLHHDDRYTQGIMLNRPSAREIDGWRVWCGGDVATGDFFKVFNRGDPGSIICLHSLDNEIAVKVSTEVIKGISYTNLENAKALVEKGIATKKDFWLFVGYAGWGPGQIEGEVKRDSWFTASADGGTLLKELLKKNQELPPPSTKTLDGNYGIDMWEKLMLSIGRKDEVESTRGSLSDRMLVEWIRVNLLPTADTEAAAADAEQSDLDYERPSGTFEKQDQFFEEYKKKVLVKGDIQKTKIEEGMVFCAGTTIADRFLLKDQYLLKSIILAVTVTGSGDVLGVVLNRPTSRAVQFTTPDNPVRNIHFGGMARMKGREIIGGDGLMFMIQETTLKEIGLPDSGTPVGASGLRLVDIEGGDQDLLKKFAEGTLSPKNLLLVSGLEFFPNGEMDGMLEKDELRVVESPDGLWESIWSLGDLTLDDEEPDDGIATWWLASMKAGMESPQVPEIADEALREWLKFHSGVR